MPRLQSSDFHSHCHTVDTFPPTDKFLLSSRRAPNPTGEDTRITQDKPADVKSPRHPSVHVKVQGKIRRCRIPSYFTLAVYQQTSLHLRHSCARCRTLCNHSVKFSSVSDTALLAIAPREHIRLLLSPLPPLLSSHMAYLCINTLAWPRPRQAIEAHPYISPLRVFSSVSPSLSSSLSYVPCDFLSRALELSGSRSELSFLFFLSTIGLTSVN